MKTITDLKTSLWDLIFILILAGVLIILSETGRMDLLMKLPFITLLIPYFAGRFIGRKLKVG
jgi:hypothetical protein